MTKDEIQKKACDILEEHDFIGTAVMDMGTGKCKLGIDVMERGDFKRILITSPRSNLKETWIKELKKWGYIQNHEEDMWSRDDREMISVNYTTIQTCYKWDAFKLLNFDLIIADEIHLCMSPEYSAIFDLAKTMKIPIVGLTGTPANDDKIKAKLYEKYAPIRFSYLDSAKDGLINKRRYILYEYELNNNYKIMTGSKSKQWLEGELKAYAYAEMVFKATSDKIKEIYFKEMRSRALNILEKKVLFEFELTLDDKAFLYDAINEDLEYFRECRSARFEKKSVSPALFTALQNIRGLDYSILGTKTYELVSNVDVPQDAKLLMRKYMWAMSSRKSILLGLNSTVDIVAAMTTAILEDKNNKLLVFSERVEQAKKLSPVIVHGKQSKNVSDKLMQKFDEGDIRQLGNCQMLTLGLNLIGVSHCIMESYTSSSTQFKQKAGRSNRLAVDEMATVIFIVPKGTQAEVWCNEVLGTLDPDTELTIVHSIEQFKEIL